MRADQIRRGRRARSTLASRGCYQRVIPGRSWAASHAGPTSLCSSRKEHAIRISCSSIFKHRFSLYTVLGEVWRVQSEISYARFAGWSYRLP